MARFSQFSTENVLMSVCGHLVLVAALVTSFVVVLERAKLVAPDRIQIMEIDLNDVTVSGEETKLYNVGDLADVKSEEKATEQMAETAPEQAAEAEPIEKPSLAEEKPAEDAKDEGAPDATQDAAPAPKKKRVIRVNREVLSLNRTLTVSVVDALRVAMTRCWTIDTGREGIDDIRAVAHLTMRQNGTVRDVWFESAARAETDPAFAYVLDTIRSAINVCQPFNMLPAGEFDKWEKIQLTFYPTQGKVM